MSALPHPCGASQPAVPTPADASEGAVDLNLGSFNAGIHQEMLGKEKHVKNLRRIIGKAFEEGQLHTLGLCEVGAHKQGLAAIAIDAQDLVAGTLVAGDFDAICAQAYLSIWQTAGASQPGGIRLQPQAKPEVIALPSPALDPQLVIMDFVVTAHDQQGRYGRLLQGLLHVRTPSGSKSPSIATRQRITKQALQALESRAARHPRTIAVLTGDVNMDNNQADAIVQPDVGEPDILRHWHVQTSNAALSGDVAFIRGTSSEAFDISIGASYTDRGMRPDSHDFFGVKLKMPLLHLPGQDNNGASQPAVATAKMVEAGSSCSAHPAANTDAGPSQGVKRPVEASHPEWRCAPNGMDYTWMEFVEHWGPNRAHREWERAGQHQLPDRNSPTYGVPYKSILDDMRAWWAQKAEALEGGDTTTLWKHLQITLFKKVRVPVPVDVWMPPCFDATQLEAGEEQQEQTMVVSAEYVAYQIWDLLTWRNQWLRNVEDLPEDTVLSGRLAEDFLKDTKAAYHDHPEQRERQDDDARNGLNVMKRKRSRWCRHQQRQAGTTQMWTLLSFTGRFDPQFFASLLAQSPPLQQGEVTAEQKQKTNCAVEARGLLRLAKRYARLRQRNSTGTSREQKALLRKLDDGTLLAEANRLTRLSGHGRLRRSDDSFVDIGGSTGGYVRCVLEDWAPPCISEWD